MTTTKNNEHKKLNFSSEREQSQACLNSAEHEKNQGRKVGAPDKPCGEDARMLTQKLLLNDT